MDNVLSLTLCRAPGFLKLLWLVRQYVCVCAYVCVCVCVCVCACVCVFAPETHSSVSAAKKTKKTCGTQVCYLLVPQSCQIQPSVSLKLLSQFLSNLYTFCLTYTPLHISNLKEIASAILEIFVPKNCPIFFTFFFFAQNYKYI